MFFLQLVFCNSTACDPDIKKKERWAQWALRQTSSSPALRVRTGTPTHSPRVKFMGEAKKRWRLLLAELVKPQMTELLRAGEKSVKRVFR
jgi:hypothetical protein